MIDLLVDLLGIDKGNYNEWNLVWLAPWGRVGWALAALVVLLTMYWSWRGYQREPRWSWRLLLLGLRAVAVAAALVLFLQPAIELRHVTRQPNHVAILVDDSRSMEIRDEPSGPTRAERVRALIARSEATFADWRQRHLLDFYTFAESLVPATQAGLSADVPARADATKLREALAALRARYDAHDLGGIIVISDGVPTGKLASIEAGTLDAESREFLAGLGARVHTAWAGQEGLADVAVSRVLSDDFAFVRTAVKLEVIVRASGVGDRVLPLTLSKDGVPVRSVEVEVGKQIREARVAFEFTPDAVGKYLYTVSTPVIPGEAIASNNSRSFVLKVIRDKIRVVQVAGRPSWDERHLRALLKRDPNVDLVSFFILRTPTDLSRVPESELSLIPFPTEELFAQELKGFDVLIMQNFNYAPYGMAAYLADIRDYVQSGGALAMLGGDVSFTSGGYEGSPVADVLPVQLLPGGPPERLISTEPFRLQLTPDGERHPVTALRLDALENKARWRALPELEGVNLIAGVRAGATVLGVHPFLEMRDGKPMPVLALGDFGKGRSLALTTDSAWHWGFLAAGEGDDGRAYDKFWENAIRWLIRDPELRLLRVQTDKAEYGAGETVRIDARLLGIDYQPARGKQITLEVKPIDPSAGPALLSRQQETDDEGEIHADLLVEAPGPYRVTATAEIVGQKESEDEVFLVRSEGLELEEPEARSDILEAVAEATGGRWLGQTSSLPGDLAFLPPRVVRVNRRTDVEVWSLSIVFWLAIAALGAEWALRRARGFL